MLVQVSATEPDKVYPQLSLSFLAAYGIVAYNDRQLLVEPEVGPHPAPITATVMTTGEGRFQCLFSSAHWTTG